jgi:hypothetical protein
MSLKMAFFWHFVKKTGFSAGAYFLHFVEFFSIFGGKFRRFGENDNDSRRIVRNHLDDVRTSFE